MNEVLKQRLVGALILLALGVIFWPIIFVQPEREDGLPQRAMPPQPGVPTAALEPPDQGALRASSPIAAHAEARRELLAEPIAPPAENAEDSVSNGTANPVMQQDAKPASVATPQPRNARPEPLQLDADGVPIAWILQVVSVSSADKAQALRQELLDLNHEAYVEQVRSKGKTLYRVYIGPKFEQAELEAKRAAIDAQFGVTTLIRRYVP